MQIKKYLFYIRYILILLLITYLVLIWMYFKDNVSQTSSFELLIGFFVIPILILASIVIIHWQYKKKKNASTKDDEQSSNIKDALPTQPTSHNVFIHSYVCMPEGEHFIDITENSDDLTVLSPEYTSFDNLPILVKPIAEIISNDDELYPHEDDIDSITQRICLIIKHILAQNEMALTKVANQFDSEPDTQFDKNQQNLTLSMHPKWQQSHILSDTNDAQSILNTQSSDTKLTTLPIYLLIPNLANSTYIKDYLTKQLEAYGFPENVIDIRNALIEVPNETNSLDNPSTPLGIIKQHITDISQREDPQLSLVIAVDSQINEEWLEAYYFTNSNPSSIVPEEAGVMLFLWNIKANSFVEFDKYTETSLIEFSTQSTSTPSITQEPSSKTQYATHMRSISGFLQHDLLSNTQSSEDPSLTDDDQLLSAFNLTLLSDISPLTKLYNLSVFMRFVDDLIDKGAHVDEHHLGIYTTSNEWMAQLISLSLFADIETDGDTLNKTLLITHDKTDTLLWMTTTTVNI